MSVLARTRLGLLCLLCVFSWTLDLSVARAASFQGLGILPNETWSKAIGLSGDGSVAVGTSCNPNTPNCEAFRWTSATGISGLGFVPGKSNSYATGISRDGATVVGYASGDTQAVNDYPYCIGAECTGFAWTAAQGFVTVGEENTAVSADGSLIVGFSAYAPTTNSNMEAYRWTSSAGTVYLGFPPYPPNAEDSYAWGVSGSSFGSGTVVVGEGGGDTVNNISSLFAFRWDPADGMVYLGALPGDAYSTASGVSFDGSVIVGTSYPSGNNNSTGQAYRWTAAAGMVGLGFLSGYSGSVATAISSNGAVVVGYATNSQGSPQAVLWTLGGGVQSVQALLTAAGVNMTGWVLQEATSVSADGRTIVGYGIDPAGNTEAWIASVPLPVSSHDFNDDGKSDILWGDSSGDLAMWLMNGATIQNSEGVGNAPAAWSVVGQRDFNGDGAADILWHDTSGNIAIWEMNGASVIGSAGVGNANPGVWSIAATGDFNGDGKGDVLWRDTSGNVAMWLMNGSSVVQSCGVGNAPSTWTIAGTGDFNGDGNADILWHDSAGNVAIWFMNGCSVIQSSGIGNASPSIWSIVGTGDFNGDGNADILWHDTSGNVAIWEMNGATVLQSAGVGNANPSVWSIAETGDFNGDGMSDILFHDTAGDVAVWEMNGAAILQSAGIGNASASVWTIQGRNAD